MRRNLENQLKSSISAMPSSKPNLDITLSYKRVAIALGSNLHPKRQRIGKALELLDKSIFTSERSRRSRLYETEPKLPFGTPKEWWISYLNCVVCGYTHFKPRELLIKLKQLESELGRASDSPRWSPRVIDLDIVVYEGVQLQEEDLTLPHPQAAQRSFVIEPLKEIWEDAVVVHGGPNLHPLTAADLSRWTYDDPSILSIEAPL